MIRNDVKGFYSVPIVGCKSNWDSPKQREAIKKRLAERQDKDVKTPRFIDTFCDILKKEKNDG